MQHISSCIKCQHRGFHFLNVQPKYYLLQKYWNGIKADTCTMLGYFYYSLVQLLGALGGSPHKSPLQQLKCILSWGPVCG